MPIEQSAVDTRAILNALMAVKKGDFSVRLPAEWTGINGKISDAFNDMVDMSERMAKELENVGRIVGQQGKISRRIAVGDAAGGWASMVDSVNTLIGDLTWPTREVTRVIGSVSRGDLGQSVILEMDGRPVQGEFLRTGKTVNSMIEQLSRFASEVTRVAREVGTEGRLGGQAKVKGVSGTWKDLTESVNSMASNLTDQVRNIAEVTTSVAQGDLSKKITVDVRGEFLQLKETTNTMVDQLRSFASEVTRVALEVGTEGKLGGQANVPGVGGTWKDLTDSVNSMASNLTNQVRNIAEVTTAVATGNLAKKITVDAKGEILELKDTVNTMVDQLNGFASEVTRVAKEVGTEGKLGGQAQVPGVAGVWKDLTDSVNSMAGNLTDQVRNIAEVTTSVAKGDLSKKITVEAKGEISELKNTINAMVDRLNAFASEVTRVAREVGTEGKLGGQAIVKDVSGVWKDLTESVNAMAGSLTDQVRNIAEVTIAVAQGDLSKKITVEAKGEILELKDTINKMVDNLNRLANEVSRVTRVAGEEGKLTESTSRAMVEGVTGSWKDIVSTLNYLLDALAMPVTEIGRVVTAISKGDLTQKMPVRWRNDMALSRGDVGQKMEIVAAGDIMAMADTINLMVDNLNTFSSEVTRVAREVGTEGQLGGQAEVPGVSGVWKDLTENVNRMATNLTDQVRNIAEVTTAVANGDLSKKVTVDVRGEILEQKRTINAMVDQLNSFAAQVTRVAREVGTDGKLGGQAEVPGVSGVWKDLTDSVNGMAGSLTDQVRNIADVTTAVAQGDLSKKITVEARGEILELKDTINAMVDRLNAFGSEVTRVAREVGTEGKLGGQGVVPDVAGVWKDLTDSVNLMASNLTDQVRNIAEVTTAVAQGYLSKKITVDAKGEILELKDTINIMVDQLNSFASEVTRVAREVGTDGKLGGQANVPEVAGVWKDLTDNVNLMASNLTSQVRNIAEVTTSVAKGDLSKKITVDAKGEILELKNTINIMVDQLNAFASEVTRVAREVGTDGKLGGQGVVPGVAGVWKDLTDNVNLMASNLTSQVRSIATVTTSVANGDLSKKITVDAKGEILELKDTINIMVDQLNSFAAEVTRVAREVGTDGKLGGQANVAGVAGVWKDLTDNVNLMASNLTSQVRNIAAVTIAVADGDLSKKITVDLRGEFLQLKDTINTMVDQLRAFASEVTRVAREVGTEGRLGGQAYVTGIAGTWKDLTDSVNFMATNLTNQVRNIATVTTAVANGDLSRKITVDVKGEMQELKDTINTMVDQLNSFASEVTRVAREVGTEGKLGGQAQVKGVAGIWKDLTDSVNLMAANLTDQVRGIAKVVTAVANGDLKQKLIVAAKGEIAALADTINSMIDTLATFGDQVTGVAREVGVEGKLGGQASVPGAAGIWKDLTENVNQLAANLTNQVRSIAEVATAVTKGDLTRSVIVEASGEVAELKDNINEMIRNLRETTQTNADQDWLKTNLTGFTRLLQGQRDVTTVAQKLLSELAPLARAQHGVFYVMQTVDAAPRLKLLSSYGYTERKNLAKEWKIGEGIVGQCAFEKQRILLTNVPHDYVQITSGLGEGAPLDIVVLPVIFEDQVKAVIELASFERFSAINISFLEQLTESLGIVLNTIEATMRTEDLLKQSQSLAEELQSQQEELQQTNEELEEKAKLLAEQNTEVERKNAEIEVAKLALEEKADQLAMTSKYKSEFLANMSHELRTPLNSLLLLSEQLSSNPEGNLTDRQVEYASTIHGSGSELLSLINDILDLSKIESGTVTVQVDEVVCKELSDYVGRSFRTVAEKKGLEFDIELDPSLPISVQTDEKRLQQILKNLLSNAFKFTEKGSVTLDMKVATSGWSADHNVLNRARTVFAFSITDTGIGIAAEKQRVIFEAFQQAEAGTGRKYGGAGLGLAISRELSQLLGGEIRLLSKFDVGSAFTLYLPQSYSGPWRGIPGSSTGMSGGSPRSKTIESQSSVSRATPRASTDPSMVTQEGMPDDDREDIGPDDKVLLIVEDDSDFAQVILDMARNKGFKGIVTTGGEQVMPLVKHYLPAAITLDIFLPDIDGWTVLDRLKLDPSTRHIPVHIVSADEDLQHGIEKGAFAYMSKPATKAALEEVFDSIEAAIGPRAKRILIVDGEDAERTKLVELIGNGDVLTMAVGTGREALESLEAEHFDCVVLDPKLPDMAGSELLREIQKIGKLRDLPVILHSTQALTEEEKTQLKKIAKNIVVKEAQSPERLLAETALFLHRVTASLPEPKRQMLEKLYRSDTALTGKKVLVVDDDVRNIFALTSVLERHKMVVVPADNGKEAIEILKKTSDFDIVLMDIMMPEMDGYETTARIRKMRQFKTIPIIALTAKAMKGDREKCLESGASDYIAKPVNSEQLLSLLRVWLYK